MREQVQQTREEGPDGFCPDCARSLADVGIKKVSNGDTLSAPDAPDKARDMIEFQSRSSRSPSSPGPRHDQEKDVGRDVRLRERERPSRSRASERRPDTERDLRHGRAHSRGYGGPNVREGEFKVDANVGRTQSS